MKQIEKMEADGTINNYVKQEQSMIRREAARQVKFFDGIDVPMTELIPVRVDRLGPDTWMEADVHGHR